MGAHPSPRPAGADPGPNDDAPPHSRRPRAPGSPRETTLETTATDDQFTDVDLHLFAEGTHTGLHRKLGAHPIAKGPTPRVLTADAVKPAPVVSTN